jgi:hypothetical protein
MKFIDMAGDIFQLVKYPVNPCIRRMRRDNRRHHVSAPEKTNSAGMILAGDISRKGKNVI